MNEAREFWKKREPTLYSMVIRPQAVETSEAEKNEILSYLPSLKNKKVLELASGIGRYTADFASTCTHLTSVDLAPQFVERNRKDHHQFKNIDFICSDAMDLAFKEGSFDFVFSNWLLMYLEDGEAMRLIDRIHSWLKPGGQYFFRESCDAVRNQISRNGYFSIYRTEGELETWLKNFQIVKNGYVKTYVDFFAEPFQNYWLCKKIGRN